jgi:hypothetical protein
MKNITKRKIKTSTQMASLEKRGRDILKKAGKEPLLAGAVAGVSLLATLVGLSVYAWQRKKIKKHLTLEKIRLAIISDLKKLKP